MFIRLFHLEHPALRLAAAFAVLATLTGCQAIVSPAPEAHVRIIDATPDAPRLDFYQDANALAFNLDSGTVTSYIQLSPGAYTLTANTAGTRQVLSASRSIFNTSSHYTLLIGNTIANPQQLTLLDQNQPAPAGQTSLRFIHQATRAGTVDLYLVPPGQRVNAISPTLSGIAFGANSGYINVPAGIYSLAALPGGTVPAGGTVPIYTGPQLTYTNGTARTIVLIDSPVPSQSLRVISAEDFVPADGTN
jgi:hypothetical protein